MASINTNAIQEYVEDEMMRRGLDRAWFGGNDIEEEGVWKWTDHTPWEFTNWAHGQPDNFHGIQDCLRLHLDWNGHWDDGSCAAETPFVCSKNVC